MGGRLTDSGQIVSQRSSRSRQSKEDGFRTPRTKTIRHGSVVRPVGRRPGSPVWNYQIKNGSHQGVHPESCKSMHRRRRPTVGRNSHGCHEHRQPVKNDLIEPGGQEQYLARIKLIDYIVERKRVQTSGCRHCPHCLNETPTKLAVCLGLLARNLKL